MHVSSQRKFKSAPVLSTLRVKGVQLWTRSIISWPSSTRKWRSNWVKRRITGRNTTQLAITAKNG